MQMQPPNAQQVQERLNKLHGINAPSGNGANALTVTKGTALAVPSNQDAVQAYLSEVAPASIVGRMVKFNSKQSNFVTSDDGEAIAEDAEFIVLADQTM